MNKLFKKILDANLRPIGIFAVINVVFMGLVFALFTNAQWAEPASGPPGSNASTPLNISHLGQSKVGGLTLNTGDGSWSPATNGLIVAGGGNTIFQADSVSNPEDPGDLVFRNASGAQLGRIWSSAAPGGLALSSNDTSADLYINELGNVAIGAGASSPTETLEVSGNIQATDAFIGTGGHGASYMHVSHPNYKGPGEYALLQHESLGHTYLNAVGTGNLYFRNDNTTQMVILDNGNVGIGTAGPAAKLHVAGGGLYVDGGNARVNQAAHLPGSSNYHLELYSPDTGDSNNEVSLRFHQGGRYWAQVRYRAGGFRLTNGNTDAFVPLSASAFYGATGFSTYDTGVPAGTVETSQLCLGNGVNCITDWGDVSGPGGSLPSAATANQTLRSNGTSWVASNTLINNDTTVQINSGADVTATGGGAFIIGDTAGLHINIDNNEMSAFNNTALSDFHIMNDGGDVRVHQATAGGFYVNGNSLAVTSGGSVGIGTTAPSNKLHVQGSAYINAHLGVGVAANTAYDIYANGGSAYGIRAFGSTMGGRFEDSDSSARVYAAYGGYDILANGTGRIDATSQMRAPIYYDRNNTAYYGHFDGYSRLNQARFNYISLGAGTDSNHPLFVRGKVRIDQGSNYDVWIQGGSATSGDSRNLALLGQKSGDQLRINWGGEYTGGTRIDGNVYANAYYYLSDLSQKKNIQPLGSASSLEKILQLNATSFNWIDSDEPGIGFIAQDMEKIFPELVSIDKGSNLKNVNYSALTAPIIEAIKEQQAQIEEQKARIDDLEARLEALENK